MFLKKKKEDSFFELSASDLPIDHLHLPAGNDDNEEHHPNAGKEGDGDEDNDEVQESENTRLLADTEDEETARQLQNFMESVTTKILERNQSGQETLLLDASASPKAENRDARVSVGTESYGSVNQTELVSPPTSKQPLLQEMSEPSQDIGTGDKSVEC